MAYIEPGVQVFQEFTGLNAALALFALPNVQVGPVFHVNKDKKAAGSYNGAAADFAYPNYQIGTFVDLREKDESDLLSFPVKVTLKNVVARLLDRPAAGEIVGQTFTDQTANIFQYVKAGDVIVIPSAADPNNQGMFTVREKTNNNTLITNEVFSSDETLVTYSIRRNVSIEKPSVEVMSFSKDEEKVSLPAGINVSIENFPAAPVVSADVHVSYRALREDKSAEVWQYKKTAELQEAFGLDQIVPENIAVYGAYAALSVYPTTTHLLGLPRDYMTDELMAYNKSFDVLKTDGKMYAISLLTHSPSVHLAGKAFVEDRSLPENAHECVVIINRQLVTKSIVIESKTSAPGLATSGANLKLTQVDGAFITSGVVPSMFVNITAPATHKGRHKILAVSNQQELIIENLGSLAAVGSVTYFIDKDLQKSEQANVIAAYARAIGSRRVSLTWPDVVEVPVGASPQKVPGYFLNCAVGALTTGMPVHQGFTKMVVALFTKVDHSTKYFDRDQLNAIADGGVMIFVQDILGTTPLYIRHQLTTDRSAIKFQEFSITKNADFIAKFIREQRQPYIGKYNITDSLFDQLKTSGKAIITFLKDRTKLPKIGGIIRSGKVVSVTQDDVNIDRVIEIYALDLPIPLNGVTIRLLM